MNVIELAEELELPYWNDGTQHGQLVKAAAMLRRQHEAIVKLRNAAKAIIYYDNSYKASLADLTEWAANYDALDQALKDTEGL